MSLALISDRKGPWPQNSAPVTTRGMYFPSLHVLHRRPIFCLSRTWWDGVKDNV